MLIQLCAQRLVDPPHSIVLDSFSNLSLTSPLHTCSLKAHRQKWSDKKKHTCTHTQLNERRRHDCLHKSLSILHLVDLAYGPANTESKSYRGKKASDRKPRQTFALTPRISWRWYAVGYLVRSSNFFPCAHLQTLSSVVLLQPFGSRTELVVYFKFKRDGFY